MKNNENNYYSITIAYNLFLINVRLHTEIKLNQEKNYHKVSWLNINSPNIT